MEKYERTCLYCHETVIIKPEDENIDWIRSEINRRYFHMDCYNEFMSLDKDDERSNTVAQREDIFGLLTHYLKVDYNYFQINRQLENFLAKGLTLKGIYYTLYYHYIINGQPWKQEYGIGIVPVIYDKSVQYWADKKEKKSDIMKQIALLMIKEREEGREVRAAKKKKKRNTIESPF